jgi:hypothetical protein
MKLILLALPCMLSFGLLACSGNDDDPGTVGTSAPPTSASSPVATLPTGNATPAASPTSIGGGAPPVDGTVAPQNAGDTAPVTIKSNPDPISGVATLRDVRVGAHPEQGGWDRIVFEFADVRPEGTVQYVSSAVQCGSGDPVSLDGEAMLEVTFEATNAHTDAGQSTLKSRQITGPGNIILESTQTCDFEAQVAWAIGLKSQKNFKVTLLSNPTRVVIDIKQ